jgi:hypothetical protein
MGPYFYDFCIILVEVAAPPASSADFKALLKLDAGSPFNDCKAKS